MSEVHEFAASLSARFQSLAEHAIEMKTVDNLMEDYWSGVFDGLYSAEIALTEKLKNREAGGNE